MPEFYRKKYGSNVLGFTDLTFEQFNLQLIQLKFTIKKRISLTNVMLLYQPIEVLKSVLITIKIRWRWESHMMNQSSPQAAFPQAEKANTKVHNVIHTNTKHHHGDTHKTEIYNKHYW